MEIKGKIIKVLPLQKGEGKNGPWKKQEYILETTEKITRKICFSLWGEKVDQFLLNEGDEVEVMFDLESREYNGRWYTEVKGWKVNIQSKNDNLIEKHTDDLGNEIKGLEIPEVGLPDDLPF